mgnify:CR=1 FL=1
MPKERTRHKRETEFAVAFDNSIPNAYDEQFAKFSFPFIKGYLVLFLLLFILRSLIPAFSLPSTLVVLFNSYFASVIFILYFLGDLLLPKILKWARQPAWLRVWEYLGSSPTASKSVCHSFITYLSYSPREKTGVFSALWWVLPTCKFIVLYLYAPRVGTAKWQGIFKKELDLRLEQFKRKLKESLCRFFNARNSRKLVRLLLCTIISEIAVVVLAILCAVNKRLLRKVVRILQFPAFEKDNLSSAG